MTLLKGYKETSDKTGEFYGAYSHGNIYYQLNSKKGLNYAKKYTFYDLKKAKISKKDLKNMKVMNVGNGREAIALSLLGAKSVDHFDISLEHIKRTSKLVKSLKINNVSSTPRNLCKKKLKENIYDFVYLNGIVHHFSNTSYGLKNCSRSVKLGGKIWVYFYRSGSFRWFVCSMIRKILTADQLKSFFFSTSNVFSHGKTNNVYTSRIMDDFFAPYIHLYEPKEYISFMEALGFKLIAKKNLKSFKQIDHLNCHHSGILVFKRIKNIEAEKETNNLLTPNNHVDQLNPNSYDSKSAKDSIKYFKKFEKLTKKNKDHMIVFTCLLALHRISASQYYTEKQLLSYPGKELPPNYGNLINVLRNSIQALKK